MSKFLGVRLPEDHWLWKEKNRSAVVRVALNLQKELLEELKRLREEVREIKEMIAGGIVVKNAGNGEAQEASGMDPRLAKAVRKFLDL